MVPIKQRIETYFNRTPFIIYMRDKKLHRFRVKDGLVTYRVNIAPKLSCQCLGICHHIIHILVNEYKLDRVSLEHLEKIYPKFLDLISDSVNLPKILLTINKVLMNHFNEDLLDYDCGICMNRMKLKDTLYECHHCSKFTHFKCIDRWFQKSQTCIYCKTPDI